MYCSYLWGHTHNKLDRFFSRIDVALAGRDYFTVVGMLRQLQSSLLHCTVKSNHLSQVWAWKELMGRPCTRGMRNLDPVHAFRFERSGGIYVQWKQWCTDEFWAKKNIACASRADFYLRFVPPCFPRHGFSHQEASPSWNALIVSKCGVRPSLSASTRSYRMNSCGCVRLSTTPCLGSTARAHRWTLAWQT